MCLSFDTSPLMVDIIGIDDSLCHRGSSVHRFAYTDSPLTSSDL